MPKHLIDRLRPDSILEFRAAARERYQDGLAARDSGRRTAAVYLFGYTAEMVLKAAYFRLIGYPEGQNISMAQLKAAQKPAITNFAWQGSLHSLESWAKLLVSTRASRPDLAYPVPNFGAKVVDTVRRITSSWRENMRYHKNIAYPHEVTRVEEATRWLLENSAKL